MKRSGTPSRRPTARTSSLNSSRNGSMSANCRSLGSPPTLWWLLMVCECFWPLPGGGHDSITSGYSVPCTRNLHLWLIVFSSSSRNVLKTSMNSPPIALRLSSGSVRPLSRAIIGATWSTHVTGRCRWFLNVSITRSRSLKRSSPLSTNTQCRRSPRTLCTSVAATVESTPPESAQMAWSSGPTCASIFLSVSLSTSSIVQSAARPAMSVRKCLIMSRPPSVCITSGWNWRPKRRRSGFSIATTAPCLLFAMHWKPSGSLAAWSPWLIHTFTSLAVR
mmetsp:Transcript_21332/g.63932  ORF Transcript_21332/g.63932 Transcript_21332/m.63932 type:complete len:277 (+) Transcript_21332:892-1722(+)